MKPPHPYADAPRLPDSEPLDLRAVFTPRAGVVLAERELELEIGPGRGGFLVERCAVAPHALLVGVEIRLKAASLVDRKLEKLGLRHQARVFAGDVRGVLPRLIPGSVARVFLHFPDPWWKKRHSKRRLTNTQTLELVARCLRVGGELFIQTDVEARANEFERAVSEVAGFVPAGRTLAGRNSPRVAENPFGARSPREHRALADGLPIYRILYRKVAGS